MREMEGKEEMRKEAIEMMTSHKVMKFDTIRYIMLGI